MELKRSSTTCLLLCRTAGSSGTCRSSKKLQPYTCTYFMYVCVCVHRATCSTVDKVEKVEKVLLKQYGNTGGTRYTVHHLRILW